MPRDIPGFYYDEEKKKYFRIQRNHSLPASSAVYSQESVNARNEEKEIRTKQQQRKHRQHIGHVKRSPLISTTSYKLLQSRIRGNKRAVLGLVVAEFTGKLTRRGAFDANAQPSIGPVSGPSFHISREGRLAVAFHQSFLSQINCVWPDSTFGPQGDYAYPSLSSLTSDESQDFRVYLHGLDIFTGFNAPSHNEVSGSVDSSIMFMESLTRGFHSTYASLPEDETIWDIDNSPNSNDVAIAGEQGLYIWQVEGSEMGLHSFSCPRTLPRVRKNGMGSGLALWEPQWNVTFKDQNVVMSGKRSGIVNFGDRRSFDTVSRLQHSSAVLGTRPTKHENQIIVHGFSTTSIYDLRYTKAVKTSKSRSKHSRGPGIHFSTPVLDFAVPSYRHTDRYSYGKKVAYSADLDMVIACSTRSHQRQTRNYVTLYSATTGRVLDGLLTRTDFKDPVTCVYIKRIRDGPESILTLGGGELLEWTMHHDLDDGTKKKLTRAQREDWAEHVKKMTGLVNSRPELYSIARLWEHGNQGSQ